MSAVSRSAMESAIRTGPLTRSVTRGLTELGAGGAFSPSASFFAGAQGFAYDLSDASKLYVDSARTVQVATAGDLIGSVSDLSGNGNHASQATGASKPAWQTTYATFDGFDDFWSTASLNFTATDKVTVVAGVRKLSDAETGMILELSQNAGTNTNSFYLANSGATPNWAVNSRGSAAPASAVGSTGAAPNTAVVSAQCDISGDSLVIRGNGAQLSRSVADQGTGNYGNYPLYIGRRGGSSLPFNGRIYRMIVIGRLLNATELARAERWCALNTGVAL